LAAAPVAVLVVLAWLLVEVGVGEAPAAFFVDAFLADADAGVADVPDAADAPGSVVKLV
jgi:hypothetical protein